MIPIKLVKIDNAVEDGVLQANASTESYAAYQLGCDAKGNIYIVYLDKYVSACTPSKYPYRLIEWVTL